MSVSKNLTLREMSIRELFCQGDKSVYEIPVYQRNYAWEKDEISALIHDVEDSMNKCIDRTYYIGTLVVYDKGDRVYEIIDGQQRLTTIYLVLKALSDVKLTNKLTYRARKKSDATLNSIPTFDVDELDSGIQNGYRYACEELKGIDIKFFRDYFLNNVHIIKYEVPVDIDLNHYFEIMNSRGEQLEKHEIVKAQLMRELSDSTLNPDSIIDPHVFHLVWSSCSEMSVYLQQKTSEPEKLFGYEYCDFLPVDYDDLKRRIYAETFSGENLEREFSISEILEDKDYEWKNPSLNVESKDTFQPIIDFPNFLLVVLKLVRLSDPEFTPARFDLDDKELIEEFTSASMSVEKIKRFTYTLFKARYLLDNYIVHHSNEDDAENVNPWDLQVLHKRGNDISPMNLSSDKNVQMRLVHLLSMFEVTYTAKQRKNYLLYCLMYLIKADLTNFDCSAYVDFLENLAELYLHGVYLTAENLGDGNKPIPGCFDNVIIREGMINCLDLQRFDSATFVGIYGDGTSATKGIPLFVFNYLDYKIWRYYANEMRGSDLNENSYDRRDFFQTLGCGDFGLDIFKNFYFSRTRTSLEHYFPQNLATGEDEVPDQNEINCFGNFAMIGSSANSTGSDWDPVQKIQFYLHGRRRVNPVGVATLKFRIMLQRCGDINHWNYKDIQEHQAKMLRILLGK